MVLGKEGAVESRGEVLCLQLLDFAGNVGWSVGRGNRRGGLEYDAAFIVMLAYEVYGNAGFLFASGYYSFVYVTAIHAFASIFRQ